ncbi:MAG: YciI family protein [Alphaproteobacteria bacterium]|nr:YciI family protein [Alphaproteobacteria bacterium]
MKFAVLFTDNPEHADARERLMPDHLTFLERHADQIDAAGPLSENGDPAGGLWIVEAESLDAATALVEADPFWPTGLRKAVRILAWRQVFSDGRRCL